MQPADGKILRGTLSLDAVVRIGRDCVFAEWIALSAVHTIHYTTRMLAGFFDSVLELIVRTSTDLPPDVRAAMKGAMGAEQPGTRSAQALTIIAQNIDQAATGEGAICQDTGMPTFEVHVPRGIDQIWMRKQIRDAVAKATSLGKLRPNSVDSITGENSGDNLGPGTPIIHFDQWEEDDIEVKLLLKGGGCENMNIQYSLPAELANLGRADRTLEGVRKCILHAVWKRKARGVRRARLACASAAIARPDTFMRKSSSSGRSTTSIPTSGLRISKRTSWARSTRSASAPWGLAETSASSAARLVCSIDYRRASSSRWRTTAGRSAGSASGLMRATARSPDGCIAIPAIRSFR